MPDCRSNLPLLRSVSLVLLTALFAVGCGGSPVADPGSRPKTPPKSPRNRPPSIAADVESFCGACHATPKPDHYPRRAWREEVDQGYQFYFASTRKDLRVPVMANVIRFYEEQAPEKLELPVSEQEIETGMFSQQELGKSGPTAVAHLHWLQLDDQSPHQLVACDMKSGAVQANSLTADMEFRTLAVLKHPAHAEPCDLDGDGRIDLIVADLGSFTPSDHARGRVVLLRRTDNGSEYSPTVLADGLGRVAEVQPADTDGDGDLDLIVAEFGWRSTGRLLLLENQGSLKFKQHIVDPRHGAIQILVDDFNQDGKPDFTTVFGQEHEAVVSFVNLGANKFRPQPVFAADRPSFGSSGVTSADMDQDGDFDIIYTNGDMFDDFYLRTYHAVHWLENLGENNWKSHKLAELSGVHRALAADLDLDGDLDIAGCSLIPDAVLKAHDGIQLDSLIWLEQTSPGVFKRHVLERGKSHHATMTMDDFDGDGDVDLAVGNYATGDQTLPILSIWWNSAADQKKRAGATGS